MAGTGLRMDTRAMKDLEDESFDFVFDKGTLDTLLCSCSSEASALKAIAEAHRVLAAGGTYVNFSYGEPGERIKHFSRPDFIWVAEHSVVGTYHLYKMTKPGRE
eukprot:TRINITY_DN7038_c0_g1_i6.p2 TRINITY_DN7038_c0_g1~~TRINITY_DN7038_c0_g1_i6.p2  ORF type:complete len:104 (-),score=18.65 TRINITY_DN7038_c0_g1_i6:196-507(-)